MNLGSFGVNRLIRFVMMNKKIKSKRNTFMFIDFLLQASLVGNILWLIMIITREIITKNYLILLIASVLAGMFSSFIDTNKIFGKGTNYTLSRPQKDDKQWMNFYFAFIGIYLVLDVVVGFILLG